MRYVATTYYCVFVWHGDNRGNLGVVDLIGFPALLTAEMALVMTAVRLLVMFFPDKRAKWGRYIKEKFLVRVLWVSWVLMGTAVWSAAWSMGIPRCAERSVATTILCWEQFLLRTIFSFSAGEEQPRREEKRADAGLVTPDRWGVYIHAAF